VLRLLLLSLLLAGCAREPGRIVDHDAWTPVALADDPWADHAPEPVDCTPLAWGYRFEGGEDTLEVDTQDCNYLTLRTETTAPVRPSDTLKVRLWHFDLFFTDFAEAHAAVSIGGETVFDRAVPIPSDSEMLIEEQAAGVAYPVGTEVFFHLHNHGSNTWNLVAVDTDF